MVVFIRGLRAQEDSRRYLEESRRAKEESERVKESGEKPPVVPLERVFFFFFF